MISLNKNYKVQWLPCGLVCGAVARVTSINNETVAGLRSYWCVIMTTCDQNNRICPIWVRRIRDCPRQRSGRCTCEIVFTFL